MDSRRILPKCCANIKASREARSTRLRLGCAGVLAFSIRVLHTDSGMR